MVCDVTPNLVGGVIMVRDSFGRDQLSCGRDHMTPHLTITCRTHNDTVIGLWHELGL